MNNDILEYNVDIEINEKEEYTISIGFVNDIVEVVFVLNVDYEVTYISDGVGFQRQNEIIKLTNSDGFSSLTIKYEKKLDNACSKEILKFGRDHWLLIPYTDCKIFDCKIDIKNRVFYVGNNIKRNDSYNLIGIALVVKNEFGDELMKINSSKISVNKEVKLPEPLDIEREITEFIRFYGSIFKSELNVDVVLMDNSPSICISFKNLIIVSKELLRMKSSVLFQYLIHEFIHQVVGNEILFINEGSLWIKESLTEFLQLLYLKERFGNNFYSKRVQFYFRRMLSFSDYYIPIIDVDELVVEEVFMSTVASKGILLFDTLIMNEKNPKDLVKNIIEDMRLKNKVVSLDDFFEILSLHTASYNFLRNAIRSNDIEEGVENYYESRAYSTYDKM